MSPIFELWIPNSLHRRECAQHSLAAGMSDYNDIARAIYASAAARPTRHLPRLHEIRPQNASPDETTFAPKEQINVETWTSNVNYGAIFLATILGGWMIYWHYRAELQNLFRNRTGSTRAISFVFSRLALGLELFIIAILGLIAQAVLYTKRAIASSYRKCRLAIARTVEKGLERGAASFSRYYDTIDHSPRANHVRQRLRYAHAWSGKYLPYPISIAILVMSCFKPPEFNRASADILPPPPDWVVKAQNRLRDVSSFHYTSAVVELGTGYRREERQHDLIPNHVGVEQEPGISSSVSGSKCLWLTDSMGGIEASGETARETAVVAYSVALGQP